MFEDFSEFMQGVYSSTNNVLEVLAQLQAEYARIDEILYDLRSDYYSVEEYVFNTSSDYVQDFGREVFLENAGKAIRETKEFDYPIFRDRLFSLVKDSRLITVTQTGNGGRVYINMETVAGNLYDYVDAIKFARERLNIGKMPPIPASIIWAEKIYGTAREGKTVIKKYKGKYKKGQKDVTQKYRGKYRKTIEMRLSYLASIAPFWYILEYGTGTFKGRGGYAYPEFEGTRFVERTRIQLQELFDSVYRNNLNNETSYYEIRIDKLVRYRRLISGAIDKITKEISEIEGGSPRLTEIDIALNLVEEYLSDIRGIANEVDARHKLKVARKIVSGDLTRTYLGGGTSVRLVRLREKFLDRLDRYIRGEYGY